MHPSEEGEEGKDERSLEEELVFEEEEMEEKAVRRESQPYLPPPEVVTARAERIVWQRSLPRDFEFSPGLDDEPVEFEDLRENDDVEVVEVLQPPQDLPHEDLALCLCELVLTLGHPLKQVSTCGLRIVMILKCNKVLTVTSTLIYSINKGFELY